MMKVLVFLISFSLIINSGCVRTKSTEISLNESEGSLKVDNSDRSNVLPQQSVSLIWSTHEEQPTTLNLQASTDGGQTWQNIQSSIPNSGELLWQITLEASQFQLRLVSSEDSTQIAALSRVIHVDHVPVANDISPAAITSNILSTINLSYNDSDSDLATSCSVTIGAHMTVSTPCFCVAGLCSVRVLSEEGYIGNASFTYTVTANGQTSNTATASLTVILGNNAPTDLSLSASNLAENSGNNAVIGTLSSTDADVGNTFTYTLVAGTGSTDNGSFNISSNTLRANASFDYETKNSYAIRVRTTDNVGLYFEKQLTINITNVNEAPIASNLNPTAGYVAIAKTINLNYSDPDSDQATNCALSNLSNVTISTACACAGGVCTVGVTPSAVGTVSFDYTVTANTQTSNTAQASFTANIGVSISDLIVDEWGIATVNVNLSATSASPITVDYVTSDAGGTATAGTDYIARNTTLTIPAGVTTKSISIPIFSNFNNDSNRDFFVNISNPTNASLLSSAAKITITNDDHYNADTNYTQVAAGHYHTCGLLTSGGVRCWGLNSDGQLGINSIIAQKLPTLLSDLSTGVIAIKAGDYHTCALLSTGALKCWGRNNYGQVGDGTSGTNRLVPTDVTGLSSGVIDFAAGANHTCALLSDNTAKCWGYNNFGQIGDNTSGNNRLTPTVVSGLTTATAIATGWNHSCARLSAGAIKCWGNNGSGQIGDNTSGTNRLVPTAVSGITTTGVSVVAGANHSCALINTGAVQCWGMGGIIGDNTSTTRLVPTAVSGVSTATAVAAGSYHTCVLLSTGAVKCWGRNEKGQIGDNTMGNTNANKLVPTDVIGINSGATALAMGYMHSCAIMSTGSIQCWGDNVSAQIGDGQYSYRGVPTDVSGITSGATSVSVGFNSTCAVIAGAAKCWGNNIWGQLGDNTIGVNRLSPTGVSGLSSGVTKLITNYGHSCALLTAGAVKCWGENGDGQIGDNSTTDRMVPTDVSGLSSGVSAIATGTSGSHNCALLTTGAVKCWGYNGNGQIGDNSTTKRLVPTDVVGLSSGVIDIAVGENHSCALLSTGAVKCWGRNNYGQLGDNTWTQRLVPIDVIGLNSGVIKIIAGAEFNCALLSSGEVKCWGADYYGQVGDNDLTYTEKKVPTAVINLSSGVIDLDSGAYHSCALLSTGALKCWGYNGSGELGDNTYVDHLFPTNIPSLSSGVISVSCGDGATCAILETGGLKCWGANADGQVGDTYTNTIPHSVVAP